jgi:hypothetical protein
MFATALIQKFGDRVWIIYFKEGKSEIHRILKTNLSSDL